MTDCGLLPVLKQNIYGLRLKEDREAEKAVRRLYDRETDLYQQ